MRVEIGCCRPPSQAAAAVRQCRWCWTRRAAWWRNPGSSPGSGRTPGQAPWRGTSHQLPVRVCRPTSPILPSTMPLNSGISWLTLSSQRSWTTSLWTTRTTTTSGSSKKSRGLRRNWWDTSSWSSQWHQAWRQQPTSHQACPWWCSRPTRPGWLWPLWQQGMHSLGWSDSKARLNKEDSRSSNKGDLKVILVFPPEFLIQFQCDTISIFAAKFKNIVQHDLELGQFFLFREKCSLQIYTGVCTVRGGNKYFVCLVESSLR